ncbi:MAG: tRNA uridine-5-carboxymethylaminomethyl(34) synthesis GTPase MnmE, partial [Elusimicrobia bacterium]|nr:tRNA uridine-5-carboxymethylaminomethyl(34) synthesis GTPase MnmE [Elusimicrobiota bacterium]
MRPAFDDTIAAIATPLGEAGLGVVRLSGPLSLAIASRLLQTSQPLTEAPPHTLHHGWLIRSGTRLDEAVAGVFRAPASYTGQDVVEISCHGSPAVLKELLRWCLEEGARLARPGEFTERAFLNGKMDLSQAEAVAQLIGARSARAAAAATEQLLGGLSARVAAIKRGVIGLLSEIEANLDFAEEDVPNVPRQKMKDSLARISGDVRDLLATAVRGRWLREGARVVLAGRPNVGKSSLFNALLAEERAIVTDVPGTTRDTLEERVQWGGYPLTLTDTAGLRDTADAVEAAGTERARRAHGGAEAVIWVIDASEPLSADDRRVAEVIAGKPAIAALNKSDRDQRVTAAEVRSLGARAVVSTSAMQGSGLTELREAVLSLLPIDAAGATGLVIANERHAERLESAEQHLVAAARALESGKSEEAVASDLRAAAGELGAIT